MHNPEEGSPGYAAGDAADRAGLQVDHKRVTKAFVHERNALVVGRDVGSLAKVRQHLDILGEMIEWITVLSLPKGRKRERRER